ncbi:MAG: tandem-95 repeat protein [Pseudomonadales bacterium]
MTTRNLESAVVQITANYVNGEDVLTFVTRNGITGSWDAPTGTPSPSPVPPPSRSTKPHSVRLPIRTPANCRGTATRTVSFTVNDGDTDSNTQTRDITVASVNDDPINTGSLPTDITVTEDVPSNIDLSAIDLSDVDHNGGNLTVTLTTSTGGNFSASSGGGVTVGGSRQRRTHLRAGTLASLTTALDTASNIQYLHATANLNGNDADTISVVVNDNGNTGSGGGTDIALGTVNVDITAVNDEEVLATNTGATVAEGSFGSVVTTAMLETTDVDNTPAELVYTVTTAPANGTLRLNGSALGVADTFTQADINAGRVTYDHNGSDTASDTLAFSVNDGQGTTTPATFIWTVTPVNDAPAFTSPATFTVTENSTAVATVTTTDTDGGTPAYSLVGAQDDALFTINPVTGALAFITAPDFETPTDTGADNAYNLTVQVNDGNGGLTSQAIAVTVSNQDEAPTGISLSSTTIAENTNTTGGLAIATLAATDPDAASTFSFAIAGGLDADVFSITGNTLVLDDGLIDFERQASYDVRIRVTDNTGLTYEQDVSITVIDNNDTPVAGNDTFTTTEDTPLRITAASLLANDTDQDAADTLTVTGITQPTSGILIDNLDGSWTYQPNANFNGTDAFTVTVTDGSASTTATVTLTVTAVNDTPTLTVPTSASSVENTTARLATATTGDIDGDTVSLSLSGADAAFFTLDGAGNLTFTGAPDFEAPADANGDNVYDVTVIATDTAGASVSANLAITVTNANEPPVVSDIALSLRADATGAVGQVIASDPDAGDTLTFAITGGSGQALFAVDPDSGRITVHSGLRAGLYTLDIAAADSSGASADFTVSLTVVDIPVEVTPPPGIDGTIPADKRLDSMPAPPDANEESSSATDSEDADPADDAAEAADDQPDDPATDLVGDAFAGEGSDEATDPHDPTQTGNGNAHRPQLSFKVRVVTSGGALLREILLEESAESASLFNVAATGLQDLLDGNDYLTPRLNDAIQQMREQFDRQQQDAEQQLSVVYQSTAAATLSLTAGFVTWLLRTGSLLATVLSTGPLWRPFDPIPVLAAGRERDFALGEDQLKTIRQRQTAAAAPDDALDENDIPPSATRLSGHADKQDGGAC